MKVDAAPRATEKWPVYAPRPEAMTIPMQLPVHKQAPTHAFRGGHPTTPLQALLFRRPLA